MRPLTPAPNRDCTHDHRSPVDQVAGVEVFECIDCGTSPLDGYGRVLDLGAGQ